jgi:flavin-dependent thymidylate synthase
MSHDVYLYSRFSPSDDKLLDDAPFAKHSLDPQAKHVSPYDQARIDIGTDNLVVRLVQGINEETFQKVVGRGVMATTGIDQNNLGEDLPWEEMMKGGLQTALETQVVVFEVFGVSRTCTHQLVRTRKATFHQQSQRATWMGHYPNLRMPETIYRDVTARRAWVEAATAAVNAYNVACEHDISYQDARWILPEGTETYIQCEYPLRTFLETYAYRGCVMFQWEHVYVMREMRRLLVEAHPWLDPYVKISCEKIKKCTFQGWERIEDHCDFPWAQEENRVYKPAKELRIG